MWFLQDGPVMAGVINRILKLVKIGKIHHPQILWETPAHRPHIKLWWWMSPACYWNFISSFVKELVKYVAVSSILWKTVINASFGSESVKGDKVNATIIEDALCTIIDSMGCHLQMFTCEAAHLSLQVWSLHSPLLPHVPLSKIKKKNCSVIAMKSSNSAQYLLNKSLYLAGFFFQFSNCTQIPKRPEHTTTAYTCSGFSIYFSRGCAGITRYDVLIKQAIVFLKKPTKM